MTTKLTLSIDSKIIESAKKYAKRKGLSISKIVEQHLLKITKSEKGPNQKNPLDSLSKLKGIGGPVPTNIDYDDLIAEAILEKHLKK
jgi:hypothetical protein